MALGPKEPRGPQAQEGTEGRRGQLDPLVPPATREPKVKEDPLGFRALLAFLGLLVLRATSACLVFLDSRV